MDGIFYRYQDRPVAWELLPISENRFRLESDVIFDFQLSERGDAVAVTVSYRDGSPDVIAERLVDDEE